MRLLRRGPCLAWLQYFRWLPTGAARLLEHEGREDGCFLGKKKCGCSVDVVVVGDVYVDMRVHTSTHTHVCTWHIHMRA